MKAVRIFIFQHRSQVFCRGNFLIGSIFQKCPARCKKLRSDKYHINQDGIGKPRQQKSFCFFPKITPLRQGFIFFKRQGVPKTGEQKQQRDVEPIHQRIGKIAPRIGCPHTLPKGMTIDNQEHRNTPGCINIMKTSILHVSSSVLSFFSFSICFHFFCERRSSSRIS